MHPDFCATKRDERTPLDIRNDLLSAKYAALLREQYHKGLVEIFRQAHNDRGAAHERHGAAARALLQVAEDANAHLSQVAEYAAAAKDAAEKTLELNDRMRLLCKMRDQARAEWREAESVVEDLRSELVESYGARSVSVRDWVRE